MDISNILSVFFDNFLSTLTLYERNPTLRKKSEREIGIIRENVRESIKKIKKIESEVSVKLNPDDREKFNEVYLINSITEPNTRNKKIDFKTKEKTQINNQADIKIPSKNVLPFIVHGHDELTLFKLKDFLHNTLYFKEPIILKQMSDGGHTIIEKFEHYSEQIDLVFVLLTPDDTLQNSTKRARQNVILELGYFMGKLGRKSGKIIVLKKGELEIPSDLKGVIEIDISNGIEMSNQKIRSELSSVVKFME